MLKMPGMRLPYVNDLFRAAGSVGKMGKMYNMGTRIIRGSPYSTRNASNLMDFENKLVHMGKRRMGIGGGLMLGGGYAVSRSVGERGLSGRSSGSRY